MKNLVAIVVTVSALTVALGAPCQAGIIVVNNDEWTLSNSGFANAGGVNAANFARNIGSLFADGGAGSFLVYSSNFGLVETALRNTMTGAGHTWTVNTSLPFTLANLQFYDGVFLGGNPFAYNANVLAQYVQAGGNVYVMGGTGAPDWDLGWNPFLNQFGLGFGSPYNGLGGNVAIPTPKPHAVFDGVSQLYFLNGNDTLDLNVLDPSGRVLLSSGSHGLIAIYESTDIVPEPATMGIWCLGGLALAAFKRPRARNRTIS